MASGGWPCLLLALTRCFSIHLENPGRDLAWLYLYRSYANAFGQPVRMWFSVQKSAPHWLHNGSFSLPQISGLLGVGIISATEKAQLPPISLPQRLPIDFTWRSFSADSHRLLAPQDLSWLSCYVAPPFTTVVSEAQASLAYPHLTIQLPAAFHGLACVSYFPSSDERSVLTGVSEVTNVLKGAVVLLPEELDRLILDCWNLRAVDAEDVPCWLPCQDTPWLYWFKL